VGASLVAVAVMIGLRLPARQAGDLPFEELRQQLDQAASRSWRQPTPQGQAWSYAGWGGRGWYRDRTWPRSSFLLRALGCAQLPHERDQPEQALHPYARSARPRGQCLRGSMAGGWNVPSALPNSTWAGPRCGSAPPPRP